MRSANLTVWTVMAWTVVWVSATSVVGAQTVFGASVAGSSTDVNFTTQTTETPSSGTWGNTYPNFSWTNPGNWGGRIVRMPYDPILTPSNGEGFMKLQKVKVSWQQLTFPEKGTVTLVFVQSADGYYKVLKPRAGKRSVVWTIPRNIPAGDYTIAVANYVPIRKGGIITAFSPLVYTRHISVIDW